MKTRSSIWSVAVVMTFGMLSACATSNVAKTEEPTSQTQKAETPKTISIPAPVSQKTSATDSSNVKHVAAEPNSKKAVQPTVFEKIYFDFDLSDLTTSSRDILSKNFKIMQQNPSQKITIEGNCDERGSAEYNIALGERRAKAALKYLVALGAKEKQLNIISYGKERPVAQGHDETAWSQNRRDEFVVTK